MDQELIQIILDGSVLTIAAASGLILMLRLPAVLDKARDLLHGWSEHKERERAFEAGEREKERALERETSETLLTTLRLVNSNGEAMLGRLAGMEADIAALRVELEEKTRQLEKAQRELLALKKELLAVKDDRAEVQKQRDALQAEVNDLRAQVSVLESKLAGKADKEQAA